jgi:hypothetical protein
MSQRLRQINSWWELKPDGPLMGSSQLCVTCAHGMCCREFRGLSRELEGRGSTLAHVRAIDLFGSVLLRKQLGNNTKH